MKAALLVLLLASGDGAACSAPASPFERFLRWIQERQCWSNPVIPEDCPDPQVTSDGATYHLVCTGGDAGGAFRIRVSTDLVHWETTGEYLLPSGTDRAWARSSFWAPEIHPTDDGWVAYYTAKDANGRLAIGVLTADSPLGPWTDTGAPLVYDAGMGMIDASTFVDADGNRWLIWKADGNAVGQPTPIYVQRLSDDGTTLVGERTEVLTNTLAWEGNLVEAPYVVYRDGWYYLFYSANAYYDGRYATGVARSRSPTGPFEKKGDPILSTGNGFAGPGHGAIVDGWFVYHAYESDAMNEGRKVAIDRVVWKDGWPSIGNGHPSPVGCK